MWEPGLRGTFLPAICSITSQLTCSFSPGSRSESSNFLPINSLYATRKQKTELVFSEDKNRKCLTIYKTDITSDSGIDSKWLLGSPE